jgi:hypothetical protein
MQLSPELGFFSDVNQNIEYWPPIYTRLSFEESLPYRSISIVHRCAVDFALFL